MLQKARTKDSLQALSKLTEVVDGEHRIASDPPVVTPGRDLMSTFGFSPDEMAEQLDDLLVSYRTTLSEDRRVLLERFEFVDFARKVVGSSAESSTIANSPSGFFMVRAASREDALAIASGCPHLRHGGTVVVRAIDTPTGMTSPLD
jgi:hypothetical protein